MPAAAAQNPAALILPFMLSDNRFGAVRLTASIAAVLFTGMIADRIFGQTKVHCDVDDWQAEARPADFLHFVRACARATGRLVPVIVIGVLLSMIIAQMIPVLTFDSPAATVLAIVAVTALSVRTPLLH